MPIVPENPNNLPAPQPEPVRVASERYRGVTVDSRYQSATSLLTHLEGMSWTVNYYSQIVDKDNALSGQNLSRSPVYQQYKRINRLELKVVTGLNQSSQDNHKSQTLAGQARTFPCGLIPNEGDMFVADIGDGREGVFRIILSDALSIYKDTAYLIDYELVDYSEEIRAADLDSKVVENVYYVSDFMNHGQNPFISDQDYENMRRLHSYLEDIASEYFRRFVSREYATLIIPGQRHAIYDPFLTKAVMSIFASDSFVDLKRVRQLNCDEDLNFYTSTLWDALTLKKRGRLKGGSQAMGLLSARSFNSDAMMEGVRFSGVHYVVYPRDPEGAEDDVRTGRMRILSDEKLNAAPTRMIDLFDLINVTTLHGLPNREADPVNFITAESPYVLSKAFYRQETVGQSSLEIQTQLYLDSKAMNLDTLCHLAETHTSWPLLDQFYQLPVLLILIRSAIRRM